MLKRNFQNCNEGGKAIMQSEEKKDTTRRVILNIPIELDEAIKELGAKRGLPKSSMILFAVSWYLDYNKSIDMMPKLVDMIKLAPDEIKKGISKEN